MAGCPLSPSSIARLMPSLPLFASESSPVAPATCCRAPLLVQHTFHLLSGATTRSTTRPPPFELYCLLVAIIAYLQALLPLFSSQRARWSPPCVVEPNCSFNDHLSRPTVCWLPPPPIPRLRCLFFSLGARCYPRCQYYLARSVPPSLPLYSLVITATSCGAPQLVQRHHHLFSSPIAHSTTLLRAIEHRRFFRA